MPEAPTRKIFVLDTSVVLYDAKAVGSFEEHDVAVPLTVLEELDQFKKGHNVINLQAREFMRRLDHLSQQSDLRRWIPLNGAGKGRFRVIAEEDGTLDAVELFGSKKNDHRILNAALALAAREAPRKVILVSKDINLRVKARAVALAAEDYETVRIADLDHLYRGIGELEVDGEGVVDRLHAEESVPVADVLPEPPAPNHYFIVRGGGKSALARHDAPAARLERVTKAPAYGISPRNAEQTFALHAILDRDVSLVTISGAAGTGKTLLALAGALEQRRLFRQIYLARPIVPLSNKDLGYLPGDIHSKVNPYMQPLWDNLSVIKNQFSETSKEARRIDEMIEHDKLHIVPLAYIRGRSFSNVMFIVDEAQNLTPHEIKTIITRAGEGSKIVLTGDVFQIDTPYLDAHSNGLSYLIDRLRGNPLYAHVNLEKGERSELANL
ncbi:MAG: PhoH family protein, partial [Thermoanaerobaculia bacterium]